MTNLKIKLRDIWRTALNLLYPPVCPACGIVTGSLIDGELCKSCRDKLAESYVTECPRCGNTADECECAPDILGKESDRSPYTTVFPLIFSGYYTGYDPENIVSTVVFNMKRDSTCGGGYLFGRMIVQTVSRALIINKISTDGLIVTYIPRSETSMNEHGFDHMEIVAKTVAEMMGCRFERLLIRKGGTAQKKLSGSERAENASRSISVDPAKRDKIRNGKILILDDIITTGSTMRAAVSRLSLAGAETVIPASAMISKKNKSEE